jgi:putative Mg2+ transporter-C (MgtC) family protein
MTIVNLRGDELIALLLSIAAAYLLALPLGWERKAGSEANIGLRVFPLVSVSSCAYLFLGQRLFTGPSSAEQSDVLQGLMTGIGFIGAGAIVKGRGEARGVATAAAIWTTGGIGASVAYGYYSIAVALCVLSLFILRVWPRLARRVRVASGSDRKDFVVESTGRLAARRRRAE